MDTQDIQRDMRRKKKTIEPLEHNLAVHKEQLARAETQLAEAIVAEFEQSPLENGDYGKTAHESWVFIGGKVHWKDGGISKLRNTYFIEYRKGNIFLEMEDATDGKDH